MAIVYYIGQTVHTNINGLKMFKSQYNNIKLFVWRYIISEPHYPVRPLPPAADSPQVARQCALHATSWVLAALGVWIDLTEMCRYASYIPSAKQARGGPAGWWARRGLQHPRSLMSMSNHQAGLSIMYVCTVVSHLGLLQYASRGRLQLGFRFF